ncbi:MAG: hypothetical protein N3A38_01800 [Planctomycetota bacterium]|nr:hypothetical protein [Planctomycetota bacterium]
MEASARIEPAEGRGIDAGPMLLAGGLFLLLGLTWLFLPQAVCRYYISRLGGSAPAAVATAEDALRKLGASARGALMRGMEEGTGAARVRCAALLAEAGDGGGERELRRIAADRSADRALRLLAHSRLVAIWKMRAGPGAAARLDAVRNRAAAGPGADPSGDARRVLGELDALVEDYPAYAEALVARGEMKLALGLVREAADDAYLALNAEEGHEGALVLLAKAYQLLGLPDLARRALEELDARRPATDAVLERFRLELERAAREDADTRRRIRRLGAPVV